MKRLTATEKWSKAWFRKLTPALKCLWVYLCDNCDCAGIIDPDWELISFSIGNPIAEKDLVHLNGNVEVLPNKKLLIIKFVQFQYGNRLNLKSTVHQGIIKCLKANGVEPNRVYGELDNPSVTLAKPLPNGCITIKGQGLRQGQGQGQEGGVGETTSPLKQLRQNLNAMYKRPDETRWTYAEETALVEIVRDHPQCLAELGELQAFRGKEPKYFPGSLSSILENWSKTLDRARCFVPPPPAEKTVQDKRLEQLRKEAEAL